MTAYPDLAAGKHYAARLENLLPADAAPIPGMIYKPRGRPPGPTIGSMTERIEIRMRPKQRAKLESLGGAVWVREQIDKAKI